MSSMRKIKLLLLDRPDQDWSKGTEVEFLVEDFVDVQSQDVFFYNLRLLVGPNVKILDAPAMATVHFVRHKYQEVGVDPKQSSLS